MAGFFEHQGLLSGAEDGISLEWSDGEPFFMPLAPRVHRIASTWSSQSSASEGNKLSPHSRVEVGHCNSCGSEESVTYASSSGGSGVQRLTPHRPPGAPSQRSKAKPSCRGRTIVSPKHALDPATFRTNEFQTDTVRTNEFEFAPAVVNRNWSCRPIADL
mmetsp:Transcript_6724/g.15385  ORF Transcript_6724/g.15385 Transcript_6724/m.15385 type:complete len:160 (-) Transcript_6724:1458-1937(-)|eukprot:CAMPEP_0206434500 /NCGR_PEP_ID=MMETSP0324_2-20121206/9208_1 /ASSEMBLY_ACC=CAM_ASM_000836 /TAXON_ID=2866 /ORGANISM="Crypthecodinium cohnii, Strain Seligo" /LENGTH=159 /DNA_ID=CAMNT_0053901053 /DNA_START=6 /DNA_END=485 /DNA_ORIENTATION=-